MIGTDFFKEKDPEQSPVFLRIQAVPNSRYDRIAEVLDDGTLKIHVKAPPVEGKANKALIKFLADFFDWPKTRIKIIQGENSRRKLIVFEGMMWGEAQAVLKEKFNSR